MNEVAIPVGDPRVSAVFVQRAPTAGDIAVSVGAAIAGIGTTAMGALVLTQTGFQIPIVLTPIARSPYR